jgi:hypothetical protein
MPNALIDDLLRAATAPNLGSQPAAGLTNPSPATEALRLLSTQIDTLRGLYQTQSVQTSENTTAVAQNTRSRAGEVGSTVGAVAKATGNAVSGSLPLIPIISSIAKLFGFGRDQQQAPALTPFALPDSLDLEGGVIRSGSSAVDGISYGQNSLPRATSQGAARQTSINVNVQTLDSRSFLDHSEDIARAVREAMLNSHPLNDVISEI